MDNVDAAITAREKLASAFDGITSIGAGGKSPVANMMVYNTGPFFGISSKEAQLVMQAATAWAQKRTGQKPTGKQLVVAIQTMVDEAATKDRMLQKRIKVARDRIRSGMSKKGYAATSPEAKKSYSAQFKKTMERVKAEPALRTRFI